MKKKGFFWHVHHDVLIEYCYSYKKRADFIKKQKPRGEIEARLALFKPVTGRLPIAMVRAGESLGKADRAYSKALNTISTVSTGQAGKRCDAFNETWHIFQKAIKTYKKKIIALHKKECPNCIWNGKEKELDFSKWKKKKKKKTNPRQK